MANKEYYQKNKSKWKVYYANKTLEQIEIHKQQSKALEQEKRFSVLAYYSNGMLCCAHCGIDDLDVLTIDHINGGGHQHRKQTTVHTHRWLITNELPEGFQVLCFNFNWKKRINSQVQK